MSLKIKFAAATFSILQMANAGAQDKSPSEIARAQGRIHISVDPVKEVKARYAAECAGAFFSLASQPYFEENPSQYKMDSVRVRSLVQAHKYFDNPDDVIRMIKIHMNEIPALPVYRRLSESFYQENLDKYRKTILDCNVKLEPIAPTLK